MKRVTGVLLLLLLAQVGCEPDPDAPRSPSGAVVEVELSEVVPTVATLRWTGGAGVTAAHVEFGLDAEYGATAHAVAEPAGSFEALLVGMKAGHEYHLRVTEVAGGAVRTGEDAVLQTGDAPLTLPTLQVQSPLPEQVSGGFVLAPLLSVPPVAAIVDRDGDYVWWHVDEGYIPGLFRVALSQDGGSVIFQLPSGQPNYGDQRDVVRMSLDGSVMEPIPEADGGSHDFVELPDGTLALIRSDTRTVEDRTIHGDRIVEIDASGERTEVWSVWDWTDHDPEAFPVDEFGGDWSHANALDHDPVSDHYWISLRNFGSILEIDRASGEVLTVVGGTHSDFATADGSTDLTRLQHQFERLDGGLLVHDNRGEDEYSSRAAEFALDDATGTAELAWQYVPEPPFYNYALGDVARLPSGNTLVTFSMGGQLDEVNPDGELVWRLNAELGAGIGYVGWVDRLTVESVP